MMSDLEIHFYKIISYLFTYRNVQIVVFTLDRLGKLFPPFFQ